MITEIFNNIVKTSQEFQLSNELECDDFLRKDMMDLEGTLGPMGTIHYCTLEEQNKLLNQTKIEWKEKLKDDKQKKHSLKFLNKIMNYINKGLEIQQLSKDNEFWLLFYKGAITEDINTTKNNIISVTEFTDHHNGLFTLNGFWFAGYVSKDELRNVLISTEHNFAYS